MDFSPFVQHIWALLDIANSGVVVEGTRLHEDLGFDSVRIFEILILVESMAADDVGLPDEYPTLQTAGDVYAYYRSLRPRARLDP